jgi:hypothetical protein
MNVCILIRLSSDVLVGGEKIKVSHWMVVRVSLI